MIEKNGVKVKQFYGMSSATAMQKHAGGVAEYRCISFGHLEPCKKFSYLELCITQCKSLFMLSVFMVSTYDTMKCQIRR